jgi:hypothetical protein
MPKLPTWKTPAERQPEWERSYVAVMERHMAQPFAWGVSDCLIVPADLCAEMCGRNPLPAKLRRYRTEAAAMKLLLSLGFHDVEEALAQVFPPIPLLRARRGDCGVLEQTVNGKPWLATLIVMGDGSAVGKGIAGLVRVPVHKLKSTFAIGAF